LLPEFVCRLLQLAEGREAVVPHVNGFDEPLAAVYRTDLLPRVEQLLAENRRRPVYLFDVVRTRRVKAEELIDVDPELDSLFNVNTPEEYTSALSRAGIEQ